MERWGVGESVFHRDRVSVWGDEKVLEMMVRTRQHCSPRVRRWVSMPPAV